MFLLGSYRIENTSNINSIPETICIEQKLKNSIVYVISDTMFSSDNYETTPELITFCKKMFSSIIKQSGVFNNVEAIVLNGNIVNNAYNKHSNFVIDRNDFSYKFLSSLINVTKNIPIYYVRGSYDCYINMQSIPVEFRGVIKFCNSCKIGNTLFIHGHNSLPFITDSDCSLINNQDLKEKTDNECLKVSESLKLNLVVSNTSLKSYKKNSIISVGSFVKNGMTVVSLDPFKISELSQTN